MHKELVVALSGFALAMTLLFISNYDKDSQIKKLQYQISELTISNEIQIAKFEAKIKSYERLEYLEKELGKFQRDSKN